jgi:hypothetical protein
MLAFLDDPPGPRHHDWSRLTVHYIGREYSAREVAALRRRIASHPQATRGQLAEHLCKMFNLYQNEREAEEDLSRSRHPAYGRGQHRSSARDATQALRATARQGSHTGVPALPLRRREGPFGTADGGTESGSESMVSR